MKKEDVLLRMEELISELYNEINTESWAQDEQVYKKKMYDFFIISNALDQLIQYRYCNSMSKEEYKTSVNNLIDKFLV
ncbi:hypothetical protein K5V21_03660 [Clostridium sardiniense]|uniref:Uncharacterized protein n=1 Tax=Clostridium sardiniense TaxID=29369 RepID=A0ABS7KVB1_CLOSR|nr:hypothetical protein [Clostridium sardiniense]MBY0754548.1 hypothetical protein [Clostridium sardiniense]MDQ0460856.1 hypothetical protein [Clostridium sardiniense]